MDVFAGGGGTADDGAGVEVGDVGLVDAMDDGDAVAAATAAAAAARDDGDGDDGGGGTIDKRFCGGDVTPVGVGEVGNDDALPPVGVDGGCC